VFLRFIYRALQYRKQRLTLAFAALAVAATLATVLFGIYGTVAARIRAEFRNYGANIIAVPANGLTIPKDITLLALNQGAEAAAFLIASTTINGQQVAVAYFEPEAARSFTTFWHVQGSRDCLAGELLHLDIGTQTPICKITGIVSTGGPEDNELLTRMNADTVIASFIQIRAPGDRVESLRAALAKAAPEASFRTVQSVAATESNVVLKIRAALLLLTLLILAITALCVGSNFSEMVLERSKEIGILKALGGAETRIAAFFISESAALALLASIAGYILGIFASAAIGQQIFGGAFHLETSWLVPLAVTLVMLAVAALATTIATSKIRGIQPAVILRGE
jgi:putative ABC transport system permease protein